ncbi:MAG: hypothetical protein AAGC44_06025 [Planctomycetota bacterium]
MNWWYAIEGRRLCRVRRVENRQHRDGTVCLTLPNQTDLIDPTSGGLFEVHDDLDGQVYLAQALSCWYEADALMMVCTPLGNLINRGETEWEEDYLVCGGHDPVPLISRVRAKSACPNGDHIRLDLDRSAWNNLPLYQGTGPALPCRRCGGRIDALPLIWEFCPVVKGSQAEHEPQVDLILLRERLRLNVSLNMVRIGEFSVTLIGHVVDTWSLSNQKPVRSISEAQR